MAHLLSNLFYCITLTGVFHYLPHVVLISCTLGPFTSDFRQRLVTSWQESLKQLGIPHTAECNLESTLADAVKVIN